MPTDRDVRLVLVGAGHATALQVPELLAHHIARFLLGGPLFKE